MSDANYRPNGKLQGDTANIPDRGVKTGLSGVKTVPINDKGYDGMGGIGSATKSDPADPA